MRQMAKHLCHTISACGSALLAALLLVQLLLAGIVMVINQKFFINGFKGLIHGSPNMDTLVAMGSMASFVWSTYDLTLALGTYKYKICANHGWAENYGDIYTW